MQNPENKSLEVVKDFRAFKFGRLVKILPEQN